MEITEEMLYKYAPAAEKLWLGSLPPDDQIPEHQFSQRFERKMKKLIRYQRHSPSMRQFMRIARQTAVVILVVVSLSFSCLMTVEAYRAKFIEVVTEVFYDLTHFTFFSSWSGDIGLGEIKFGYLPDGMVEVQRESYEQLPSNTVSISLPEYANMNPTVQTVGESSLSASAVSTIITPTNIMDAAQLAERNDY